MALDWRLKPPIHLTLPPPTPPSGKPLRLPVTDVVKTRAGALALGGKLEAGALRAGSRVVLVPGGHEVGTVKSVDVDGQVGGGKGRGVGALRAGSRVVLVPGGHEVGTVSRRGRTGGCAGGGGGGGERQGRCDKCGWQECVPTLYI